MINVNQLKAIRDLMDKLKDDFEIGVEMLESMPKYKVMEVFKDREAKWRELLASVYEEVFTQYNSNKELLLKKIFDPIDTDREVKEEEEKKPESLPQLVLKVTWKRVGEGKAEPFMFEPVGNSWGWVNYKQSKCFDPNYQIFNWLSVFYFLRYTKLVIFLRG